MHITEIESFVDNIGKKKRNLKPVYLALGSCIVCFILGMSLVIPIFDNKQGVFEAQTAIQAIKDQVVFENQYGRLEVYPATSNNIITQTQYANVTWKYPANSLDIAFRFDEPISNADVWIWKNISHDVYIPVYDDIEQTYLLENITSFTPLINPTFVSFGDLDSAQFYNVNASMDMGAYWLNETWACGFDSFQWLNSEHTRAEATYEKHIIKKYVIEQQYWFDWDSIKDKFEHTIYDGKHYYYISDIYFNQDETKQVKWQYDIPIGTQGKWDLLAKRHSDTIQEALQSGNYVMIDPWWNSNWNYYKALTIESYYFDEDLEFMPVFVNSTNTTLISKCQSKGQDIRFVGTDNSTEYKYEIETWTATGFDVWVNITRVSGSVDTTFLMYYNNSGASDNQDIENVWHSSYRVVHHLNESSNSAGDVKDSTANNVDNIANDAQADALREGMMGHCFEFGTSVGRLHLTPSPATNITDDITIEFWWEGNNPTQYSGTVNKMGVDEWSNDEGWSSNLQASATSGFNVNDAYATTNVAWFQQTAWHYFCHSWTKSDTLDTFNNATETSYSFQGTESSSVINAHRRMDIGSYYDDATSRFFEGLIDEVRLSDVKRNQSYFDFVWNNTMYRDDLIRFSDEREQTPTEGWNPITDMTCNFSASNTTDMHASGIICNFSASNTSFIHATGMLCNFSASNTTILQQISCNFSASNTTTRTMHASGIVCNFSASNSSYKLQVAFCNFSASNSSIPPTIYVNFSAEYPSNNSINIPLQPTAYVTIQHLSGLTMNASFFYGNSSANTTILLQTFTNITNSTQTRLYHTATSRVTEYFWRVQVDDGTSYYNATYNFTTEATPMPFAPSGSVIGIVGVIGVIGIIALIVKNKKEEE